MLPIDRSKTRIERALSAACGLPLAILTWALWLAVALGYLGTHVWIFDLFANFRLQYMGLFALCVVALTIIRWRKTAIVALLGVAFTTASMAPYFQERATTAVPAQHFRLLTFNLWFRNDDVARAAEFVQASGADVVILEEVDIANIDALARMLPAYPYRATTPSVRLGVAMFSRWPLQVEHLHLRGGVTRIARARVDWKGTPLTIIGAHLHWPLSRANARARSEELQALAATARSEAGPVLLAGDFNLTPWSRFFARFVEESGLQDCAIGQGLVGTWPAQVMLLRIRIDQCFASSHWRVYRVDVGPRLGSDHLPTIVDLGLEQLKTPDSEEAFISRRSLPVQDDE